MSLGIILILLPSVFALAPSRPHIVHILVDDYGWNEVGYHNRGKGGSEEVLTPNIDALVDGGLELDRHYVHKICSPSRVALQSGRSPIHSNVQNVHPEVVNEEDEFGGFQGMPLNMTSMADVMKSAGYSTHMVGKWDVGMASNRHTPYNRGYDEFLGYFHHSNDYWQQTEQKCYLKPVKDLWLHNATHQGPATWLANDPECSQKDQAPKNDGRCVYEEAILLDGVLNTIDRAKSAEEPMFLFYATHLTHMPLQVPKEFLEKFDHVDNEKRRSMRAMSYYLDLEIGRVVDRLKDNGMWDATLLVLHADNGGEIMTQFCGGNNYPLRGGKFSNFEGGIRVNAVVSGGALPQARRGQKETGFVAGEDWLRTYAAVAGVADRWVTDPAAAAAGLPGFDSVNQWPLLSGETTVAPREEIVIGDTSAIAFNGDGKTLVGGVIDKDGWKILLGAENKKHQICQDVTTPADYPDGGIRQRVPEIICRTCGSESSSGCLFNVFTDPTESDNRAAAEPEIFARLKARVGELQEGVYSPDRGKKDKRACRAARDDYGGYWGPFLV